MRTIKELAQEAIDVTAACNLLGLSKGYATALQELVADLRANDEPSDTQAICLHPINRLWLCVLCELAHVKYQYEDFSDSYWKCGELAK